MCSILGRTLALFCFATTGALAAAIRAGNWKLIEFFEDRHLELYNLKDDLGEDHDLAAQLPDKAQELRDQLTAWRESLAAKMPPPNADYKASEPPAQKK